MGEQGARRCVYDVGRMRRLRAHHGGMGTTSTGCGVASLPLIEIVRIGEAPPETLPRGERPLAGIRVLDLTRVLAGPTCARTLAEHGADVLKIIAPHLPDSGSVELDTGLGKLSTHLDLRNQQDVETLRTLVRGADVFSQSYRPGALAGHGFSPEALAEMRPGIVCVELRAWGREAPWRERRGFDTIVQTATGMALVSGQWHGAAANASIRDRLCQWASDGVRRDGRADAPRPGERKLAGARIISAHR